MAGNAATTAPSFRGNDRKKWIPACAGMTWGRRTGIGCFSAIRHLSLIPHSDFGIRHSPSCIIAAFLLLVGMWCIMWLAGCVEGCSSLRAEGGKSEHHWITVVGNAHRSALICLICSRCPPGHVAVSNKLVLGRESATENIPPPAGCPLVGCRAPVKRLPGVRVKWCGKSAPRGL